MYTNAHIPFKNPNFKEFQPKYLLIRAVASGGALAPLVFGRTVNPISTRGADYAHHITTGPPGFSDLPTALDSEPDSSLKHQMSNTASSSSVIAASLTSTSSSESSRFVEFLELKIQMYLIPYQQSKKFCSYIYLLKKT